jgi:hypothetical protein
MDVGPDERSVLLDWMCMRGLIYSRCMIPSSLKTVASSLGRWAIA